MIYYGGVSNCRFWWDSWGAEPNEIEEKVRVATRFLSDYPKLIPIYSHRYVPEILDVKGVPVFSVRGYDTVRYGDNLAEYIAHEFCFKYPDICKAKKNSKIEVEFWSELAFSNWYHNRVLR